MNLVRHRDYNNYKPKQLYKEEEEEDYEEDTLRGLEVWERNFEEDMSWEPLQQDERPINNQALSAASVSSRIPKGLIRYLYVVMHLSQAAGEMDFGPSKMVIVAKRVHAFIRQFFDLHPLSQIGLVIIRDGVTLCLTNLNDSLESHMNSLMEKPGCSGDSSLQNTLDLVHANLSQISSYGHREVLILYEVLSTCDQGDIMETIQKCKKAKIRCSVIELSEELFIGRHLCQETGGSYTIARDERRLEEILLENAQALPAIAECARS